jgi:hypothetical protein
MASIAVNACCDSDCLVQQGVLDCTLLTLDRTRSDVETGRL